MPWKPFNEVGRNPPRFRRVLHHVAESNRAVETGNIKPQCGNTVRNNRHQNPTLQHNGCTDSVSRNINEESTSHDLPCHRTYRSGQQQHRTSLTLGGVCVFSSLSLLAFVGVDGLAMALERFEQATRPRRPPPRGECFGSVRRAGLLRDPKNQARKRASKVLHPTI